MSNYSKIGWTDATWNPVRGVKISPGCQHLKAKGYPYQFVFCEAADHVDQRVQLQTRPETSRD